MALKDLIIKTPPKPKQPRAITGWAIAGRKHGFYAGTASTRNDAIAQHVYAFNSELLESGWPAYTERLSDLQKEVWEKRKAAGDMAVKVTIQPVT